MTLDQGLVAYYSASKDADGNWPLDEQTTEWGQITQPPGIGTFVLDSDLGGTYAINRGTQVNEGMVIPGFNLNSSTGFSISMWVERTGGTGRQTLWSMWPDGCLCRLNSTGGAIYFSLYLSGVQYGGEISGNVIPAGSGWVHFVAVWNGADLRYYLDTVQSTATPAATGTLDLNTGLNDCGWSGNGAGGSGSGGGFVGNVDILRLYDRALTVGEIDTLYNAGRGETFPTAFSPWFARYSNTVLQSLSKAN